MSVLHKVRVVWTGIDKICCHTVFITWGHSEPKYGWLLRYIFKFGTIADVFLELIGTVF